jgi:hypothetical protein
VKLCFPQGQRGGYVVHNQFERDIIDLIMPNLKLKTSHMFHLAPEVILQSFQCHHDGFIFSVTSSPEFYSRQVLCHVVDMGGKYQCVPLIRGLHVYDFFRLRGGKRRIMLYNAVYP